MARSRGGGDDRGKVQRDGPAGAGTGPSGAQRRQGKSVTGQQSGSNRPAVRTGTAKKAPKKGDVPLKGVKRVGAGAKKSGTRKDSGEKALSSKKASRQT